MAAAKKPKIRYEWRWQRVPENEKDMLNRKPGYEFRIDWEIVGANGETMCKSTQGFRDKTDARRGVQAVADLFTGAFMPAEQVQLMLREVGPGKRPDKE